MKKMTKIEKIIMVVMAMIMLYFSVCYVEILIKNLTENPQYSDWNLLVNLIEYANNKHFN